MPTIARSFALSCAAGLFLQGCASAPPPPPGRHVSRLLIDGTPYEARMGALDVFAVLGDGWIVGQGKDAVTGSYEHGLVSRKVTLRFLPASERGRTDAQATCDAPIDGANAAAKCDALLKSVADSVGEIRARAAAAPPPIAAPAPVKAAPAAPARTASDVDKFEGKTLPARPNDFALVIGIEDYRNVSHAPYAERDAESVALDLEKLGVPRKNMVVLTGTKATRSAIARNLEGWLGRDAFQASRVYFYFAGLGAHDPQDGTAYLLPADADPAALKKSAYPLARVYQMLQVLRAKDAIAVLDCGFSGEGGRSVGASGGSPAAPAPPGPTVSLFEAARDDQLAGVLDEQSHGLFTYYLLKGLQGAADADRDGHVRLDELEAYARREMGKAARLQQREQNPRLSAPRPDLELY